MPLPRAYTCNVYRSRRECKCACTVPLRHPPLSGTGLFPMNITAFTSAATKSQTVSAIMTSSGEDSPGDTLLTSACRKLPGGGIVHARMEGCSTALLLYTLHSTQLEPRAKQKLQTTSQHQPCKLQAHRLEADAKCYMLTCQQCADFLILSTLNSYSYTNRGTRAVNCELRAA